MSAQDKQGERLGWPNWDEYPNFGDLTYRPLYIDDIAGTLGRAALVLEDLTDRAQSDSIYLSYKTRSILDSLLLALEDYSRARSLAEYCFQLNRSDPYFAAERERYRTERIQLNDLMRDVYQAILDHDDLLLALADENGKMPLFHVQNQTAINRHTVNPQQELENDLVAQIQDTGHMVKDFPLAFYQPEEQLIDLSEERLQTFKPEGEPLLSAATGKFCEGLPTENCLNRLLDDLLRVRSKLAQTQGFSDFVHLGYRRLGYFDLEPAAALKLHDLVADYVVPLAVDLRYLKGREEQSKKRGGDLFYASSIPYKHRRTDRGALVVSNHLKLHPYLAEPRSGRPGRVQAAPQADRLFNEALVTSLGGHVPDFWQKLREKGYIQIYNQPAQELRSKCYRLFDPPFPVLYCNHKLSPETLAYYFNIAGRAYGYLCCSDEYNPFLYLDPGLANIRIWGKGMEFLAYFGADLLFETELDADRWRFCHMANTILEMPLLALLDSFQFRLHMEAEAEGLGGWSKLAAGSSALSSANTLSTERRDLIWLEEVARFFPDLASDQDWLSDQAGKWMMFRSTYTEPFSPLSKLMASLTGISLWQRSLEGRSAAVLAFENFCTMTNDDMLLDILSKSRLPSPFSKTELKRSMYRVSSFLDDSFVLD